MCGARCGRGRLGHGDPARHADPRTGQTSLGRASRNCEPENLVALSRAEHFVSEGDRDSITTTQVWGCPCMSVTFGQWVCVTLEVAFIQALILGLVACAYDGPERSDRGCGTEPSARQCTEGGSVGPSQPLSLFGVTWPLTCPSISLRANVRSQDRGELLILHAALSTRSHHGIRQGPTFVVELRGGTRCTPLPPRAAGARAGSYECRSWSHSS